MKHLFLDVIIILYYIIANTQAIPCMWRLWRRKSSIDYSLMSEGMGMMGTVLWTIYIFMTEQTVLVNIGTLFDFLISALYTFLVFLYHKPRNRHNE